ncbi:MAG: BON domain-containing protein, partial [Abyssibacter sp.]|uniref:BON domain-containing protein n=1 Tax=Abyssibacter sp. TaxID=2320200 RepID=UPI00321A39E4
IEIAAGMDAILDVNDEIDVQPDLDTRAEQDDSFGDTMDDASTTAAVKTRLLANDSTSGLSIDVDTNDAVVTLSGRVESEAEADLATQIALNTDGVDDVVDKLTVEDASS